MAVSSLHAGEAKPVTVTGDRLSGFVLPIEPIAGDIQLRALRANSWTVDDTKRLLLQGDVQISIGAYGFQADRAVVWLNRIPSAGGLINQIAVYFDDVSDPTKQAGLGARGDSLLVTASSRGQVILDVALLEDKTPPRNSLIREGEARLAAYLLKLIASPPPLAAVPRLTQPPAPDHFVLRPGGAIREQDVALPKAVILPNAEASTPWLANPDGIVRFSANHLEVASGAAENTITIIGSIAVEYFARENTGALSQLSLSADRAVIFTAPGPLQGLANGQLEAQQVYGIYLEGNVIASTEGSQYIVRAPHVYYDFRTHQAIMVKALLRMQTRGQKLPLYARAEEMRQLSDTQWETRKTVVSTSEFFTPHLSIGSETATITQREETADGETTTQTRIESMGNTLRAGGIPLVYWPRFAGDVESVPLKSIIVGTRKNIGLGIETNWNLFTLLGQKPPEGLDAELSVDGFTERGAGAGLLLKYDVGSAEGKLDLYQLYDGGGDDRTTSGENVDPDREWRGVALLEYQTNLSKFWSLQVQGSLISDDTFITAWRPDDFTSRREYETAAYLKHQRENAALTLLGKYSLNDFLSNDYLLASRAYSVDKVPELGYRRYGDSLFHDHFTYSTQNSVSRMRLVFEDASPNQIGVPSAAFGIGPNDNIEAALKSQGYRDNWVGRFDTRHELAMPMHEGIFNIMPFIVGRFTGYWDDFTTFSSDTDPMRLFGAIGVRINTQFQKVTNDVESRLFDLYRLRHLVQPYLTLWGGTTNVNQDDLPTYDQDVESIAEGGAVQFGILNTLQTQRGGPGHWHSVDFLTVDLSVVLDSEGKPDESPTPQFFDYQPELSQFGTHARGAFTWLVTDSLSLVGEGIYVIDTSVLARGSIGTELRHSPLLSTYIEYRFIDADQTELLGISWLYQFTPKIRLVVTPQYDFRYNDFRAFKFRLTRAFPDFEFNFQVKYDQIADETTVGASLGVAEF